jgi:hypothetical protein
MNRLVFLRQVPTLLCSAINTGDEEKLICLINESCSIDCKLKTSALLCEVTGRQYIIDMFNGIFIAIPDFVVILKKSTFDHRLVTAQTVYHGTRVTRSNNDYLYDFLSYNDVGSYEFPEAKLRWEKAISEGKQLRFVCESNIYFIMNEEMTHFNKLLFSSTTFRLYEGEQITA